MSEEEPTTTDVPDFGLQEAYRGQLSGHPSRPDDAILFTFLMALIIVCGFGLATVAVLQ